MSRAKLFGVGVAAAGALSLSAVASGQVGDGAPPNPGLSLGIVSSRLPVVIGTGKLKVSVSVVEPARVTLIAKIGRPGHRLTIARLSKSVPSAGAKLYSMRVTKAGRRALRRRSTVGVRLSGLARDAAGKVSRASARGTLYRKRPRAPTGGGGAVTMALVLAGSADGRVTSEPAGIDCRSVAVDSSQRGLCKRDYPRGSRITLTGSGGSRVRFGGDCTAEGSSPVSCTLTMDGPKTIDVDFNP